jgi:hypothetical protein
MCDEKKKQTKQAAIHVILKRLTALQGKPQASHQNGFQKEALLSQEMHCCPKDLSVAQDVELEDSDN